MEPKIDHVQITVKDMSVAVPFYEKLMPLLGFDPRKKSGGMIPEREFEVVEWKHPLLCFAINSPRKSVADQNVHRRSPGALHHLAFKASSREEVDKLFIELETIGAVIVGEPQEYKNYTPAGYYALYFKDLEGIKYEIVHYEGSE